MSKISHMIRATTGSSQIVNVLDIEQPDVFDIIGKLCDLSEGNCTDPLTGLEIAELAEAWYLACDLLAHVQHCARQEQAWENWKKTHGHIKKAG